MVNLQLKTIKLMHAKWFSGGITIAGALGTGIIKSSVRNCVYFCSKFLMYTFTYSGAHGSSLRHPTSLSDQVVGLTIIDGTGQIRQITDLEELKAFRVHLGLLGVVLEVTLKTVPLFKMTVTNTVESETILLDGTALNWTQQHDLFEMWWFPSAKSVVVSKGLYTIDLTVPGNASSNLIPDASQVVIAGGQDAFETLQGTRNEPGLFAFQEYTKLSLFEKVVGKPALFSEDGGNTLKNPAVGYAWQLLSNKCTNKCTWENGNASVNPEESSMAFELTELPNVVRTIKSVLSQVQASFYMIGVFIRFSRPSDAYMAISSGRPTVTFEYTTAMRDDPYTTSKDGIGAYQAILQTMVIPNRLGD